MYTHGSINLVVNEQNRAERKPANLFSRFRSLLSHPSGKENEQLAPAGEIGRQSESPC
jgi:hypothetical protein